MGSGVSHPDDDIHSPLNLLNVLIVLNKISNECSDLSLEDFVELIRGLQFVWKDSISTQCTESDESIIFQECFWLICNDSETVGRSEVIKTKELLSSHLSSRILLDENPQVGLLDLIALGRKSAADSFSSLHYRASILHEPTEMYSLCADAGGRAGFFLRSPPASHYELYSTCAAIDDWDTGLTLRHALRPPVPTVRRVVVPAGTLVYEGVAAPAAAVVPVDPLAAEAFRGGGAQIFLSAPARLAARWHRDSSLLPPPPSPPPPPAGPWDVLGYEAAPLSCAMYAGGPLPPEAGQADARRTAGRLGFGPLHHACMGGGAGAAEVCIGVRVCVCVCVCEREGRGVRERE